MPNGKRKQQGIILCAVAQGVIGGTCADPGESPRVVERSGRVVLAGHFEQDLGTSGGPGKADKLFKERGSDPLALRVQVGGDGQYLAFTSDHLRDQSTALAGQEMHMRTGERIGDVLRRPWPHLDIGPVHDRRKGVGCHGSITGAVSRAGAASAGLI